MRSAVSLFDQYVKLNKKVPPEVLTSLSNIDDPSRLADTLAAHMALKVEEKQEVLEMFSVRERLEHLMALMESENGHSANGKAYSWQGKAADGEESA